MIYWGGFPKINEEFEEQLDASFNPEDEQPKIKQNDDLIEID